MKPNDHYVSTLDNQLQVIENKKKNDEQFLKPMGSNANLSDKDQAQVWSVHQGMMDEIELRCDSYAKTLLYEKIIISVRVPKRSVPEIT